MKSEMNLKKAGNGFIQKNLKIIKWMQKVCPSYIGLTILEESIQAFRPFLNMYMAAEIIDEMIKGTPEKLVIRRGIILISANMILALIQWLLDKVMIVKRRRIEQGINASMAMKAFTMDYQVLEHAKSQEMITRIKEGETYSGGIVGYGMNIAMIIRSGVSVIYSFVILLPLLFGSTGIKYTGLAGFISSPAAGVVFVLCILFAIFGSYRIFIHFGKLKNENFELGVKYNRRYSYFGSYIGNYKTGKSVRIFNMLPLILSLWENMADDNKKIWHKSTKDFIHTGNIQQCLTVFISVLSYIYIGIKAISGMITIGELTLYVGAVMQLYTAMIEVMDIITFVNVTSGYLINYVDYLELSNEKYDGTIPVEKRLDNEYELEFCNVSFHYPNSDELVLDNVNVKIHVGRKMAIVGRNGSGKSTFIKLLCRLYDPTEGEIRLNGIDIRKYNYDEYRDLFSVVFQDFELFSFPVAWNVASDTVYEEERVWEALSQAGLKERVKEMEKGLETVIYKQEDEGVEISGGEEQKLAIARALYKDAPVVILDEPTAALDPVSELEIYEHFDDMVDEKTAIYISHRMSSCRFCENILVFDKGNIVEMGSHEQLIRNSGLYAKLWTAQAQYYEVDANV